MSAPEDKILEAQRKLAELEGIFIQPASATILVGFLELAEKGKIGPKSRIVLILTGSGMKASGKTKQSDDQVLQASLSDLPGIIKSVKSD